MGVQVSRNRSSLLFDILLNGIGGALPDTGTIRQIDPAHARLGGELQEGGAGLFLTGVTQAAGQLQRGLAFGGLIVQAGQGRAANKLAAGGTLHGEEVRRQAVSKGNGARLIQDHGVHVAAGLHRLSGHGDHIKAGDPVHTGNADGGEQAADGGGDQADHQCDQRGNRQLHAAVNTNGVQSHNDNEKNDGQRDQQSVQGNLVGSFLPGGALYQGDHPVQKAVARLRGNPDL